jgi:dethiobiotin synthetase
LSIRLSKPGLFVTATDTEVGKTVATCAIASWFRRQGRRVGVSKPISSGCRLEREGLVNADAEALAHFADCRANLDVINPVRYREPLAPAVAAERAERPVDDAAIAEALARLDADHDVMLVEGIGGLLVPLDARRTVLDLACEIGYPVLVVVRPALGTLSQTAMTCRLIREAGLRLAGIAISRFPPETHDVAMLTNRAWLTRQNRTSILATLPEAKGVRPEKGELPAEVLEAVNVSRWDEVIAPPAPPDSPAPPTPASPKPA